MSTQTFDTTNYALGAGAFVFNDKNQILLTLRLRGLQPGVWEVPAGGQDEGETTETTAVREVKEETNLDTEVTKLIGTNTDHTYKFLSDMYLLKLTGGTLINTEPHAHGAIEWFDIDNLPKPLGSSAILGLRMLGYDLE